MIDLKEKESEIIVSDEMWETELDKQVQKEADKIIHSIEEHQKKYQKNMQSTEKDGKMMV